jgi:hypothetical protein
VTPEDEVALRRLVDRYADAVDGRDSEVLRHLFTTTGVLRVQADGGPVENEWSGAGVVQSLDVLAGFDRTFHHVGGCVFDDDGEAVTGRVHCLGHHYERTGNGPVDLVMMIRYHDRYERQSDGWRIAERRVAIQWTELHPAHPKRRARQ